MKIFVTLLLFLAFNAEALHIIVTEEQWNNAYFNKKRPDAEIEIDLEQAKIEQKKISEKQHRLLSEVINIPFKKEDLATGLEYLYFSGTLFEKNQSIHIIRYYQKANKHLSLLPIKSSAGVHPGETKIDVHKGPEETVFDIAKAQPNARVIINGVFHHYSKTMYPADRYPEPFQKGDPAQFAKYREHKFSRPLFSQFVSEKGYIYRSKPGFPTFITFQEDFLSETKLTNFLEAQRYVLTCSPVLVRNFVPARIEDTGAVPLKEGVITPPGNLAQMFITYPRTMIAVTKHDDILFIAIDGFKMHDQKRSSEFDGMDFAEQVAFLMSLQGDLEVKHACNLDGGGSTTMYIRRGDEEGQIVNQPADPGRAIGNVFAIFDQELWKKVEKNVSSEHAAQVNDAQSRHEEGFQKYLIELSVASKSHDINKSS